MELADGHGTNGLGKMAILWTEVRDILASNPGRHLVYTLELLVLPQNSDFVLVPNGVGDFSQLPPGRLIWGMKSYGHYEFVPRRIG
jgi:hypothetical protein